MPAAHAFDFLLFCVRNPRACPLLEVIETPGVAVSAGVGTGGDMRVDVPLYRAWGPGGAARDVYPATELWRPDLVTFLLGCSFGFEDTLHKVCAQGVLASVFCGFEVVRQQQQCALVIV